MNPINHSHQNKNATWTALVSLKGLESLHLHAPDTKIRSKVHPGKSLLIELRPMAANISWVSTELNFLRSISKEIALGGLDRAIEAGFVEIVGYTTGDSTRNRQVDAITTNLFGIQIERCSKSRGCSCR